MTDEEFENAPKLFADIGFGLAEGRHPETGDAVVMGYLTLMHNGQTVVCMLCKEMVEQISEAMREELPNVTFSAELVNDPAQKRGNEYHVN